MSHAQPTCIVISGCVCNKYHPVLCADTLIALEIFAFNFVEIKRWQDFKKPGSQGEEGSFVGLEGFFKGTGENGYPGGVFDPLGLSKCDFTSTLLISCSEVTSKIMPLSKRCC